MRRLLPLVLLACGAPQPAAVALPPPVAPASASAIASATPPPAPPIRRRVAAPDTNGCLVHAEAPYGPRALRVSPDGAAYATVKATDDERVLYYRGGTVPYVELETADGGLRLRGYAEVPLRATKPFALGGVIVPKKRTELRWAGTSDDGHVTVSLALPPAVTVDGGHVASGLVACDALAVLAADNSGSERPDEKLDKPFSVGKLTLAVRADHGGAVRATVDLDGNVLYLGELRGASRHVDIPFDDFIVRGWVPAKIPGASPAGLGSIGLGHLMAGRRGTKIGSPACAAPLAVYAKSGTDFVEVGTVGAQFPVKLAEKLGDYARIDVGEGSEAGKLAWYARTTDLEACHATSVTSGWRFE